MKLDSGKWEGRILGESIRGASHVRSMLPNQDAIHWLPASGMGPPMILAVADGHGSPKSFRSDRGAYFAVTVAAESLQHLLTIPPDNLSSIKRAADEQIPRSLTRAWEQKVLSDVEVHPFTIQEQRTLIEKVSESAWDSVEANPLLAYGATLIVVLVTKMFMLFLQLGDGDILTVSESGEVTRPLERDKRLFANETTSLCKPQAWQDFLVGFQVVNGSYPALVMLSTDGCSNSYADDAGFERTASDLFDMIRADGISKVQSELGSWLTEVSWCGSGDDTTLGMIVFDSPHGRYRK